MAGPNIISTSPNPNATGVVLGQAISIVFDSLIDHTTLSAATISVSYPAGNDLVTPESYIAQTPQTQTGIATVQGTYTPRRREQRDHAELPARAALSAEYCLYGLRARRRRPVLDRDGQGHQRQPTGCFLPGIALRAKPKHLTRGRKPPAPSNKEAQTVESQKGNGGRPVQLARESQNISDLASGEARNAPRKNRVRRSETRWVPPCLWKLRDTLPFSGPIYPAQ
jgi:hypothetical protein